MTTARRGIKYAKNTSTPEEIAARVARKQDETLARATLDAAVEYVRTQRAAQIAAKNPPDYDIVSRLDEANTIVDAEEACAADTAARTAKHRITSEDYYSLSKTCREDPRLRLIYRLQSAMESLERDMSNHIYEMQREASRIAEYGAAVVYDSLTSGSRWHDIGNGAAKVRTLVEILGSVIRANDDPEANDIDRFVHERLNG